MGVPPPRDIQSTRVITLTIFDLIFYKNHKINQSSKNYRKDHLLDCIREFILGKLSSGLVSIWGIEDADKFPGILVPLQKQPGSLLHTSGVHGFDGSPATFENKAASRTTKETANFVGDIAAL